LTLFKISQIIKPGGEIKKVGKIRQEVSEEKENQVHKPKGKRIQIKRKHCGYSRHFRQENKKKYKND